MRSHISKFTKLRSSPIISPPSLLVTNLFCKDSLTPSSPSLTPQHHHRRLELLVARDYCAPSGRKGESKGDKHKALGAEGQQLRQHCIPHVSLLDASASPWCKLYYSYNNQALITVTGFSYHAFEYLVNKFTWYFDKYTPFNGCVTRRVNRG